jgi:hypothetical protein
MGDIQFSPEFEDKVRAAMDVPSPNPEFVKKLHTELVRSPVRMKSQFMFRPAWAVAFILALAVFAVSVPGISAALERIFGYVPDVGLVENTGNLRILAEPASLMRDGVTLIITNVIVYEDRVELIYEVEGIAPSNDGTQAEDANTNPTAFCGGVNIGDPPNTDGDARLRLPGGTILERESTGLYPQNVFAMKPVYKANIPPDVMEMTLLLKCIPWARLGALPENWEVPIKLLSVPAKTIVGEPVIEVQQPTETPAAEQPVVSSPTAEVSAVPAPIVKMTIEKIVPMESASIFYFSMDMENKDPSLISIMPVDAYLIDSQGQKIDLIGNYTWQPFEHRAGSLFEYRSASKPADGPVTVVVEDAVAYYAPMYVEPPQATPEEMSFTFDAGSSPQHGQMWALNNEFEIAGYPLKVSSAHAVIWEDVQEPSFIDGSQGYDFGYQFAVEFPPSVKMNAEMDIMSESPMCGITVGAPFLPEGSSILYTQLCRDTYPSGLVKVTIRELSILIENTWQSTWTP